MDDKEALARLNKILKSTVTPKDRDREFSRILKTLQRDAYRRGYSASERQAK